MTLKYIQVKNLMKSLITICCLLLCNSCDDFLNIIPLNDVVLENYWTEEADVISCVNSCYAQLESESCLKRMLVWGEVRSDNLTTGTSASTDLQQVIAENLLDSNGFTEWESFYQCINRCNTVIYYAPSIHEIDPNYTEAELKAHIAEVTALRCLCYFYLIRTFRDVPYVTDPSISDTQNYYIAASSFDDVLTALIADLERVKDDAVRSYGEDSEENMARITRWSIYALLADLYLWQGNYTACIDYCDKIIAYKQSEYEEIIEKEASPDVELYGAYPLISEAPNNSSYAGTAYTQIFGSGLSFESIFELNFIDSETIENGLVRDYYGSVSNSAGQLSALSYLYADVNEGTNNYFTKTDCRYLSCMSESSSSVYIRKYVTAGVRFRTSTTTGDAPTVTETTRSRNVGNWIIYRLTDVMLMKAEAEVELAGNIVEGSILSEDQLDYYKRAFACVSAVWKRANNKRVATTDTLLFDDYATSRITMEDLVFDERQREFLFEGKRWFDLVRLCRREGSNTRMINKVIGKFKENTVALRIKLSSTDYIYFPYNEDELKANPYLEQNPAFNNDNISTTN